MYPVFDLPLMFFGISGKLSPWQWVDAYIVYGTLDGAFQFIDGILRYGMDITLMPIDVNNITSFDLLEHSLQTHQPQRA